MTTKYRKPFYKKRAAPYKRAAVPRAAGTSTAGDLKKTFQNIVAIPQGTTAVAFLAGKMENLLSTEDRNLLGNFGSCKLNYVVTELLNVQGPAPNVYNGLVGLTYIDGDAPGGTTMGHVVNKNAGTKLANLDAINSTPATLKTVYKPLHAADRGWIGTTAFLTNPFGGIVTTRSQVASATGQNAICRVSVSVSCKMEA